MSLSLAIHNFQVFLAEADLKFGAKLTIEVMSEGEFDKFERAIRQEFANANIRLDKPVDLRHIVLNGVMITVKVAEDA